MKLCSFTSGSSGNCIYLDNEKSSILIDCGISGKYLDECLTEIKGKIPEALLITHEHLDHVSGLGILMRKYSLPVFLTEKTLRQIECIGKLGKVDRDLFNIIAADRPFNTSGFEVQPFSVSHDAEEPVAFRIHSANSKVAIATDMGCYNDYIVENLKNLDAMLIEANHDINMLECGNYSYSLKQRIRSSLGHLSNDDSAVLLSKIIGENTKNILLGHLSSDNNYHELARLTVENYLQEARYDIDINQLKIEVAKKKTRSRLIEV